MSGKRNRTLKGEAAGEAEAEGASPCSNRVPAHGRHSGEPACGPQWRGDVSGLRKPVREMASRPVVFRTSFNREMIANAISCRNNVKLLQN